MTKETRERIGFLNSGPWIKRGRKAWQVVAKRPEGDPDGKAVSKKQKQLKKLLKAHWKGGGITYDQGVIRDSFDEALTVYQLYELAIENGYIALPDIEKRVRAELAKLLWSDGARIYLWNYNYTSVAYLAQRVGIDLGFKEARLPDINPGAAGRFASFLSQHSRWYDDAILDRWLAFLDDYLEVGDLKRTDKQILWDFLKTDRRKFDKELDLWTYVAGADDLIGRLAELAASLTSDEKPSYGMFYAYWMQKLYGYDLGQKGFFRDRNQADWPERLISSKRIKNQMEVMSKLTRSPRAASRSRGPVEVFSRNDKIVRNFWEVTRRQLTADPIEFR